MKKYSTLLILIICLAACQNSSKKTTISGEIKGLGTDTLYLYGMDESYDRIDTIYTTNDQFSFTTQVDTLSQAYLLFSDQTEYPLFVNEGNQIQINGDIENLDRLTVTGNPYSEELTAFQDSLYASGKPSQSVQLEKAEAFIRQHTSSFASLYLLDKYFVRQDQPNFTKVKELTALFTGILQDKRYVEQLNDYITQYERVKVDQYAPFFSLPNAKGEKITRSAEAFKQKHLLINFWASWDKDSLSIRNRNELRNLYRTYKKNKYLSMLGISFDIDQDQWLEAIRKDTLAWEQVCDLDGLNGEVSKQYAIDKLPTNLLLTADGKILARDIQGEALKQLLKKTVAEAEAAEKAKNKKRN